MPPRRVVIVGGEAWRPRVDAAFAKLGPGRREVAAAALRYMHDLHVGVTPELAADLARALDAEARDRGAAGPWDVVFERLADQLSGGDGRPRRARRERRRGYAGLVPGSAPFYSVARIAAPLVARASEALDRVYLFAADPGPCPEDFAQRYGQYAARLAHELRRLASSDELSEVFWVDRALTLGTLSRGPLSRSGEGSAAGGLPEVDAVALAQVLRLEPRLDADPLHRRSVPRRLTSSPRFRPLTNRNEGGVDGIFQTRRLADLPGILKSEFLNPRPMLLERLLESGFQALRRPPLKEKQRDVLVAGILPPPAPGSAAAMTSALVKAAWFEAMARLALWLRRAGRVRSELLWLEADEAGRRRDSRCRLEHLPESLAAATKPTPAYRREFLAALGWLPGFLDQHAPGRRTPAGSDRQGAVEWSASAFRGLAETETYDTVHLMLFLPRKLERTTSIGVLRSAFGLPPEPGYSVGVTWLPDAFTDLAADTGWAVSVERRPTRPLLNEGDAAGPELENRLAGALLGVWLKTILGELVRDG